MLTDGEAHTHSGAAPAMGLSFRTPAIMLLIRVPCLRCGSGGALTWRRVQKSVSWCCPCPRWMSWCLMCGHDGGPAPSSTSLSRHASSSPSPKFNLCLVLLAEINLKKYLCSSGTSSCRRRAPSTKTGRPSWPTPSVMCSMS